MDNNSYDCNCQEMNEARKPKRTFEQACRECNAVPLEEFEKEFWEAFEEEYRKHGIPR